MIDGCVLIKMTDTAKALMPEAQKIAVENEKLFFSILDEKQKKLAETISVLLASPIIVAVLAGPLLGEWAGQDDGLAIMGFYDVSRKQNQKDDFMKEIIVQQPIGEWFAILSAIHYVPWVVLRSVQSREVIASGHLVSHLSGCFALCGFIPKGRGEVSADVTVAKALSAAQTKELKATLKVWPAKT
ncbi:hypothetical protein GQR58_026809 [Nymphon striatum]|nr:hypothetical protein GQR58_026809 [Nymphon striatum]